MEATSNGSIFADRHALLQDICPLLSVDEEKLTTIAVEDEITFDLYDFQAEYKAICPINEELASLECLAELFPGRRLRD